MVRVALACLIMVLAAGVLGPLGARDWGALLAAAAVLPFAAVAYHVLEPELLRWSARRRAARR